MLYPSFQAGASSSSSHGFSRMLQRGSYSSEPGSCWVFPLSPDHALLRRPSVRYLASYLSNRCWYLKGSSFLFQPVRHNITLQGSLATSLPSCLPVAWLRLSFPPWKSTLLTTTTWSWPFATTHFIDKLLNFFYQGFSFRTSPCSSAGSTHTEDLGSVSALPVLVKGGSRLHLLLCQALACESPPDLPIGVNETCASQRRWDENTNE